MRKIAAIGFCLTCALWAEDAASQQVQVTKTDHLDFTSGGLLSRPEFIEAKIHTRWVDTEFANAR